MPVTVAECLEAGIVASNPVFGIIFGMCMRLFCVHVALCLGSGLARS
jgi:hypothetical protein